MRPRTVALATVALATVAAAILAVVAVPAQAAQAQARTRHTPTCQGLSRVPRLAVWTDIKSERSALASDIPRLVCSAADGSTIRIKSWFILADDAYMLRLANDLRLMHQYHHVRVDILVGDNVAPLHFSRAVWTHFLRTFSFARIYRCAHGCLTNQARGISHSKWITVSRLRRTGAPAVLSTSANFGHQQLALTQQSGIFIGGSRALYDAFDRRFAMLARCSRGPCDRTVPPGGWIGPGATSVYFAPVQTDLWSTELSGVDCSRGGSIKVVSLYFRRSGLMAQLLRLRNAGCSLRVLLEHRPSVQVVNALHPRYLGEHDKYMVVVTPGDHVVLAGSENLSRTDLSFDDNQTVRTHAASAVSAYTSLFAHQWRLSHPINLGPSGH